MPGPVEHPTLRHQRRPAVDVREAGSDHRGRPERAIGAAEPRDGVDDHESSFDSYPSACGTSAQRRTRSRALAGGFFSQRRNVSCGLHADTTIGASISVPSTSPTPRTRSPSQQDRVDHALRPHLTAGSLERRSQGARHLAAATDRPSDPGDVTHRRCRAHRGRYPAPPARFPTPSGRTSPRGR